MASRLIPIIESINKSRGYDTRTFYIPTVNAGSSVVSTEYLLPVTPNGIILSLKIRCSSLNYSFYLTNRAGTLPASGNPDVIYSKTAINKSFGFQGTGDDNISPNEFNVFYTNKDTPPIGAIYLTISNNDSVNPTGIIYLNLTIAQD